MSASLPQDQTTWVQQCAAQIVELRPHIRLQTALAAARDLWGLGWNARVPYIAAAAACEPLPHDPPYTEFEWAHLYTNRCLEKHPDLAGDDASELAYMALEKGLGCYDPYDVVDRVPNPVAGRGVGEPHELPKERGLVINPPRPELPFEDDE